MNKSKLNENFIINLQGKSFVTYEGLLDYAHQIGLKSIEVEIIQIPSPDNNMTAICQATARTEDQTYTDIGDASPSSLTRNLVPHLIRMASTRAKARALRDLANIGMTAFEELSIEDNSGQSMNNLDLEPPTNKQVNMINQLSSQLNETIDLKSLNKRTAGTLISELIARTKSMEK